MENSELKNTKNGWFRNFLFGKRKRNTRPNKITCNCCETNPKKTNDKTVQTNTSNNKDEQLNINTYGSAKEIQQNRECPGKVFPMEQRGCGFHLYFCIGNVKKSELAKGRKIKNPNYDRRNIEVSLTKETQYTTTTETNSNNINLPDDRETGYSAETLQTNRSFPPFKNPRTASNTKTNMAGKEVSSRPTPDRLPEFTMKKVEEKDKEKGTTRNQRTFYDDNLKAESILRIRKTSSNISLGKEPSCRHQVRISSVEEPIYPETRKLKHEDVEKSQIPTSSEVEDEIFKEYEVLRKQNLGRKTTIKSRTGSTFVRNSLISMRKQRYSVIEAMIPEILSKLCEIEEKITEWKAVCEDKGSTKTIVGISCNNAKSKLSINIKSQESKNNLEKETSPNTSKTKETSHNTSKTNLTVFVKARPEDVNASERASVVSEKMRSIQLIYHNTQELDAHRIGSTSFNKSRKNESQNKKSDEVFPQSKKNNKNQVPDKWRRISEELKM